MSNAIAKSNECLFISSFDSARSCIKSSSGLLDIIVYHSHEPDSIDTVDVASLSDAFSSIPLLLISDATDIDSRIVRDTLTRNAAGFIFSKAADPLVVNQALDLLLSGGIFVSPELLLMDLPPPYR